jgi:thioredoxin
VFASQTHVSVCAYFWERAFPSHRHHAIIPTKTQKHNYLSSIPHKNNNNNDDDDDAMISSTTTLQSRISAHYASTSSSSRAARPTASATTTTTTTTTNNNNNTFAFRHQHTTSALLHRRNKQHQKRNGSSSVAVKAGLVEKMNAEQLEVAMADRSTPLVIDFYATWCGPCVLMSAELEKVKEQLGEAVRCIKVDTDEETELATQLAIEGLPTIVFVSKDAASPALRTEGMIPAETVISIIENQLQG